MTWDLLFHPVDTSLKMQPCLNKFQEKERETVYQEDSSLERNILQCKESCKGFG